MSIRGTCYKAANWIYLWETRGFVRVGKTYIHHCNRKSVLVYFINPAFPKRIAADPCCRHQTPNPNGSFKIIRAGGNDRIKRFRHPLPYS